jgi:hypothetical protein
MLRASEATHANEIIRASEATHQYMKYSTLKDISLASQSNIIDSKGLSLDSAFLQ